jgi:hypothetical protein
VGARIWFCKLQLVVLSGELLSPPPQPPKKILLSFFHIWLESGYGVAIGWWRILYQKRIFFLSSFFWGKTFILEGE